MIGRSIVQGHPLQDGNKRLGILLMTLFLSENGLRLQASEREITETALSLAQGTLDFNGLRSWLEAHTCRGKILSEKEGQEMASITLELSPEVEARLGMESRAVRQTPENLIVAAIEQHLDDLEDAREAQRVVAEIDAGRMATRPWGEVRARLGLDD